MNDDVRAPFPYFGGKRWVAPQVWRAFGRVQNYVEPFFGSGAVLLARPRPTWATPDDPGTETVNDKGRFLANFWRALKADPEAVAAWCDYPVNETDLHARHRWLLAQLPRVSELLDADPDAFDAKVAGWWVWGACAWIGTGWCDETRERRDGRTPEQLPHLGGGGNGSCGVHAKGRRSNLAAYLTELSARLRGVRVACGDWTRVTGDSVTWRHGLTAVFLDPPYSEGNQQYAAGGTGTNLSADVRAWALSAGKRKDMRVILAGYDGEHNDLETQGWHVIAWKARGGYASQGDDENVNAARERLWLSPHCLHAETQRQRSIFDVIGGTP